LAESVPKGSIGYALSEVIVRYHQFGFPLDIDIRVSITELESTSHGVRLQMEARFVQCGEEICAITSSGVGLLKDTIDRVERRKAKRVLAAAINVESPRISAERSIDGVLPS
jgi:hypothetical protein